MERMISLDAKEIKFFEGLDDVLITMMLTPESPNAAPTYDEIVRLPIATELAISGNGSTLENVWDFEHYMTTNNFDGVDVVHFQMGTNDIIPYSVFKSEMDYDVALETFEDSLSKLPGRLRGMISSIHAYDSSIKIAINPPMVAGLDETFNQKAIRYAETEFFALKEHENVFVLPSYVGIGNLSVAGGYIGSGSEVSSINSSKIDTISNNVHPDGMGQLSNALWVASWIAHQIA